MIERVFCLLSLMCVSAICGYAHEVNKAFFEITEKDSLTEVRAEFPWTLREALIDFNPDLNNSNVSKADFESTFIKYLDANLQLIDAGGSQLPILRFIEIKEGGHAHQNTYLVTYIGVGIAEISNTVMFNVFDNQVNYNDAIVGAQSYSFKTSHEQSGVILESAKRYGYVWWLFALLVSLGILLLLFGKVKKSFFQTPNFLSLH